MLAPTTYGAIPSVPAAPDPTDGDGGEPTHDLLDDESRAVGFLDVPHLDGEQLMASVLDGFSRLADDAVLTAYSAEVDADGMAGLCEPHGIELVHCVPLGAGTTFILRRSTE